MVAARKLTEMPEDIILYIMHWIDVEDILRMQRVGLSDLVMYSPANVPWQTCRSLQILSLSRSLWMKKVPELDATCAPSLPPHVPLGTLSDSELRGAILASSRSFDRFMKGEVRYGNQRSIVLPPLYHVAPYDSSPFCTETLKLTPGGRFLVVSSIEVVHVIDVHHGGRCIWSRSAASISHTDPRQRGVDIGSHAVDLHTDGSMNILLLCKIQGSREEL